VARPSGGYTLQGERIPGVTTFTSIIGEPGGLMQWAYAQGKEHQRLVDAGEPAPSHLYDARDQAADAGTIGHELTEDWILHNKPPGGVAEVSLRFKVSDEIAAQGLQAYEAYRTWERQSKLEIVETEMSLVSREHRFGGTLDAIGILDGQYTILDWKTSNAVYPDHMVQLAMYGVLVKECTDYDLSGGFHLLRMSKEHGDFTHHFWSDLDEAERAGLLCRELYEIRKSLKRRVK
jgi:hypothetical protein